LPRTYGLNKHGLDEAMQSRDKLTDESVIEFEEGREPHEIGRD